MAEYGTSVETTASPDKVWKVWSDMSTWGEWNPNVSTMEWQGGFQSGTTGVMNTRAGQHHKMKLLDVVPQQGFALETSVVPLTTFRFNCRIGSAATGLGRRAEFLAEGGRIHPASRWMVRCTMPSVRSTSS